MKLSLFLLLVCMIAPNLLAQAPGMLTYQGRVTVNGTGFTGTGQFKFALVNTIGTTTYWSNDSTSSAGSQPTAAVTLTVSNGVYSVLLGDTILANMTAVPATVFTNADVRLRVWFNDGVNGWLQLTPDQRIASVGYALMASAVADGAITSAKLANGITLAGTPAISGSLSLPSTTSSSMGAIMQNGESLLQTYGSGNTFSGLSAGNFTLTGAANTGIGFHTLQASAGGNNNTAVGYGTMTSNTNGDNNTAVGTFALELNTSGSNNTAMGRWALINNQTGGSNSAIGMGALFNNDASNNTALGYQALYSNTSGTPNTAVGTQALYSNTTGISNIAIGHTTLYTNTTGKQNVAVGLRALFTNATGDYNTAIGTYALELNTTGASNIAVGRWAMNANTTGNFNTAVGMGALFTNNGSSNTAVGHSSLYSNTAGNNNTSTGYLALLVNTADNNTAFGSQSLYNNTTGSSNICIGFQAGYNVTTGSNNIIIGDTGSSADTKTIRIGTSVTHTKAFIAGISGVTSSGGAAVYVNSSGQLGTATSSRRFKEQIETMGAASEAILHMRPVSFRYKPEIDTEQLPQFGLIAEEVAQIDPMLVVRDAQGGIQSVRYEQVNAMLLNEFLKDHQRAVAKDAEVAALQRKLQELQERDAARDHRERELEERLLRLEQALSRASSAATTPAVTETKE